MFSISKFYLFPHGYVFRFLSFINDYFKIILFGLFISIVIYPSYHYFYELVQQQELLLEKQQLTDETTQKHRLYQSLSKHNEDFKRKERSVSKLNQQLQQLFNLHQIKLEQMQWNLEQEKSIYFSLNHQVVRVFNLLRKLSKVKQLRFKEINLVKLNSEKQLQLKATFMVMEDENE
ncbi:chromosome segregation protein [Actinobacillus equuli]|uniref:chromosome segregation protein n=1 Tax=Actinobacillus equuli TaxID=718 RepID=UPI002442A934|nr:chromosome segregation protein [Actinobacillus equuli]WGE84653.1 chromosome segregation protein [Actinobacillus equuli subsp. haemolyticus]